MVVEIILIVIMVWGAVKGYKRGLVASVGSLVSQVFGFFIALNNYWLLVAWADSTFKVKAAVYNFLQNRLKLPPSILSLKLEPSLPDLGLLAEKLNLPEGLASQLSHLGQGLGNATGDTIILGDVIYQFLTKAILNTAAFLIIWAVTVAVLMLLVYGFQRVTKLSIIGFIDGLGGMLAGVVVTILILSIIFGLLNPFIYTLAMTDSPFLSALAKNIESSRIVPYYIDIFQFLTGKIIAFWL